jgi:AcrR family transcriptional regulator
MFILTPVLNGVNHGRVARAVGQHHGDLRQALIAAALELVAESDAAEVTLRAVARRAGVSAAAPYHHFPDKDALIAAVARTGFEALSQVQLTVLSAPGSAVGRLEELVKQYVLFAVTHRTHYDLMFATVPSEIDGVESEALREAALSAFGRLVEAIRAANPALSTDEAARRALLSWAMAHGAVDVGRWGEALRPGLDAETLAADVGRAVGRLALGG